MATKRATVQSPEPKKLEFALRKQQAEEWCWAAVSQAVARHFDPKMDLHQCQIVGSDFKKRCCGDAFAPNRGSSCNRPGYLHKVLERLGLLAKEPILAPVDFPRIQREIEAGRPVCLLVRWRGSQRGHFIVIAGYSISNSQRPVVHILDPLSPQSPSSMPYDILASQEEGGGYQDGQGVWFASFLVKPNAKAKTSGAAS
jgi:hypothetical protein